MARTHSKIQPPCRRNIKVLIESFLELGKQNRGAAGGLAQTNFLQLAQTLVQPSQRSARPLQVFQREIEGLAIVGG